MIKTNAFFQMFGFTSDDFYAVEIVGGSMRIPAFKIAAAQAVGVFKGNIFFGNNGYFFWNFFWIQRQWLFFCFGNFLDDSFVCGNTDLIFFYFLKHF